MSGHDGGSGSEEHNRLERLADAAIEAELHTGRREETIAQARTHVLMRLGRIAFGFTLAGLGLAMLVLPGPGLLVLATGLVVLSRDFVWAERTLAIVRRRLPQGDDGRIPARTWALMGLATTIGVGASVWWTLAR